MIVWTNSSKPLKILIAVLLAIILVSVLEVASGISGILIGVVLIVVGVATWFGAGWLFDHRKPPKQTR